MKDIQMVDLLALHQRLDSEISPAVSQVMKNGKFINGPEVTNFTKSLQAFSGAAHVVTCGNGTDALQIALMTLDLQPGDEVLLPAHTYVATAEVIGLLQLTPVFVDVYQDTFNIDISHLERSITPKSKAIVPVHLYGQCCDMEHLLAIAQKHKLSVIEDAAQALGAEFTFSDGTVKQAGTMGDIGCTSFFPSKNLGCMGDGGALLINDASLAQKARMIANHGQSKKYQHDIIGCNSRLDTIQAAILDVKIKYLSDFNERRRRAAEYYTQKIDQFEGVETPKQSSYSSHIYNQYTIKIKGGKRDQIKETLQQAGVPSMIYYPTPLHQQKAYAQYASGKYRVTEQLSTEVLSLPIHTEMTEQLQDYILEKLEEALISIK